jgi:hypothetical protein
MSSEIEEREFPPENELSSYYTGEVLAPIGGETLHG